MRVNKLYFQLLLRAPDQERRRLLRAVESYVIKEISETAYNLLHGAVSISRAKLKRLVRYKQILRSLSLRNVSLSRKRTLLQTRAGSSLLGFLLPFLIHHLS